MIDRRFLVALLVVLVVSPAVPVCAAEKQAKPLKKVVLSGQVNMLAGACAAAGITIEATTLPTRITQVRMGSPAYYSGVLENDRVIQGSLGKNIMMLKIERNKQIYAINLRYTPDNLYRPVQRSEGAHGRPKDHSQLRLQAALTKDSDWKQLKQYQIAVLLDSSGSMGAPVASGGESKWQWCQQEIYSFGQEAEQLGNGSFDLCTFAGDYDYVPGCNAEKSREILSKKICEGGTELEPPLTNVIDRYFASPRKRPLLVVIITDGIMAHRGLEDILIDTAKRLKSPESVRILFLQIGEDQAGEHLARILDQDLMVMGAPYDIVESVTSGELLSIGLRRALVAGLAHKQDAEGGDKERSAGDVRAELERVREELSRLRSQMGRP